MKHISTFFAVTISLFFVFTSCSNNESNEAKETADTLTVDAQKAPDKQELYNHILELEKEIFDTTKSLNRGAAIDLMVSYAKYANSFPNDSLSPEFLYKAAEVARGFGDGKKAIGYYELLLQKYPNYSKRAVSLFMIAFTYDNLLKDTANAGKFYRKFIKEYPNHKLAEDAKQLLKFLGKNPEDIIKGFDK